MNPIFSGFPRLYGFRHLGDSLHGLFFVNRKRTSPWSHHIPLEPVLIAMRIAELHCIRKIRVAAKVGTGGNLIKPSLVQPLVRFDICGPFAVDVCIKCRPVVPVGLQDASRHALQELVLVAPDVVAPNPWTTPRPFCHLDKPEKIVPPQFPLPTDGKKMPALKARILFVVSKVKEARTVENLNDVLYQIFADLIVLSGGNHPVVLLEPRVVASREVHLRNHLKPQTAQPRNLRPKPVDAPATLDGKFRMTRIDEYFGEIDDYLVASRLDERIRQPTPRRFVKAHMICATASQPLFRQGGILRFKRNVLPGIDAEMCQIRPCERRFWFRRGKYLRA